MEIRSEIRKLWGDDVEKSVWEETKRLCDEKLEWDNIESRRC
jgi:hypothetical protein